MDSAVMPKIGEILFWYYIIIIKINITIKEFLYMYTKQLETFSTKKQDHDATWKASTLKQLLYVTK